MPDSRKCPHCGQQTLQETAETVTDSAEVDVRVWRCTACDYTEGQPITPVEEVR